MASRIRGRGARGTIESGPIRVLLVCDFPIVRAGFRSVLRVKGIRLVGEAATEAEAFRLMERAHPDVAIIACEIGLARGVEMIGRLKRDVPKVSAILIGRSEDPLRLSTALALGCSGYFLATISPARLIEAIRRIARGECVIDPPLLQRALAELVPEGGREVGLLTRPPHLTLAQLEVLRLMVEGLTNREIAERRRCSLGAVKDAVQRIIERLGVSDRTRAAVVAVQRGLVG
jgi:DNA-binding NarL/FixJ family response regulator